MKLKIKHIVLKIISFIIAIVLFVTGYHIINFYRSEKDAGIILKSIVQLELERKEVIQVSGQKYVTYLTKSDPKYIIDFMKDKGWLDVDQMGAIFLFRNSKGDTIPLVKRLVYSSGYSIWEVEDLNNKFKP